MSVKDFIISDLMSARDCDHENYRFIDTIRYEREIGQTCSDISHKIGVNYISCCLILPGGAKFIISNNPGQIAIPYHIHGLIRIDNAFSADRYKKNTSGFFIPSEIPNDRSGYLYEKISSEFGIENTIGFLRNFQGYQLIIIFSHDRSNEKPTAYPQREKHLCNYAIDFFEKLLLFYAHDKPQLKYSRFCQDAFFRNKFICGEFNDDAAIAFKERELQCLYWAQMGKTAEEIAIILDLKKSTVRGYLEDIREKCGVSCIQEAIVLATQQKLISCG